MSSPSPDCGRAKERSRLRSFNGAGEDTPVSRDRLNALASASLSMSGRSKGAGWIEHVAAVIRLPAGISRVKRENAQEYDSGIMTHAALFVSLILSYSPAPPAIQSCSLPGLWLGQDRDKDAVGMWLEFAEDASVVRANGRIVDGGWEMKDGVLLLESRGPMKQKVALKIDGNTLTRTAEAATWEVARELTNSRRGTRETNPDVSRMQQPPVAISSLEQHSLTRVTPAEPNHPAIVGIWGYKNKSGRTVLERYTAKRNFAVLEPLVAQRGTYKVASNKLSVTAADATTEVLIVCGKNSFELAVGDGKLKFVRFE